MAKMAGGKGVLARYTPVGFTPQSFEMASGDAYGFFQGPSRMSLMSKSSVCSCVRYFPQDVNLKVPRRTYI